MFEKLKFLYQSGLEAQNFPAWELYVFFTVLLLLSIIIRLHRLEKKIDDISESQAGIWDYIDEVSS